MTLFIFEHMGEIGAKSDLKNGRFMNDPEQKNQLGVVVSVDDVEIQPNAVEVIKKFPRENGSFADLMLMGNSIAILEKGIHAPICISRDCDLSTLDKIKTTNKETPRDFIEHVESNQ